MKAFTLLRTKTEVFKNALQSGYLQKRRFLKTLWISVKAQKWIKTKMLQQQQQNTSHISRQIQR